MRLSRLGNIWISAFNILAMLFSSFAFSAPPSKLEMLGDNHSMTAAPCAMQNNSQTASSNMFHTKPTSECAVAAELMASCCIASCYVATGLINHAAEPQAQPAQRSVISLDPSIRLVRRISLLYRPPIV
ncbi:hypothetical protein ACVFI8_10800 [Agarivorans sp. MS3-6]